MLPVSEIARRLGVSDNTVRNWLKACRDLIDIETGPEGYRRYALRPFERIAAMRERKVSIPTIRAALAGETVERERGEPFEDALLARLDRLLSVSERSADALERIATYFEGNEPERR